MELRGIVIAVGAVIVTVQLVTGLRLRAGLELRPPVGVHGGRLHDPPGDAGAFDHRVAVGRRVEEVRPGRRGGERIGRSSAGTDTLIR